MAATSRFNWQPVSGPAVVVTIDSDGSVRNHDDVILGRVFRARHGGWGWERAGVIETRTGCTTQEIAVSKLLFQLRREGKV